MSDIPDQRSDDAVPALDTWLCFDDLRRAGIVSSWKTLGEWQRDDRIKFPKGRLLAPNTRRWSKQHEIDPWLKDRPVERDGFDDAERSEQEPPLQLEAPAHTTDSGTASPAVAGDRDPARSGNRARAGMGDKQTGGAS